MKNKQENKQKNKQKQKMIRPKATIQIILVILIGYSLLYNVPPTGNNFPPLTDDDVDVDVDVDDNVILVQQVVQQQTISSSSSSSSTSGSSNPEHGDGDGDGDDDGGDIISINNSPIMNKKDIQSWRQIRNTGKYYEKWFAGKKKELQPNADSIVPGGGPILDFIVAGFPKCGTTGLIKTLQKITPYPGGDKCMKIRSTIKMSYNKWKNINGFTNQTFLRGTKCPRALESSFMMFNKYIPKTKLIVGMRHPVLWFQSFYNMQMGNFPKPYANVSRFDTLPSSQDGRKRNKFGCIKSQTLFCVARAEFHLAIAKLGKTDLKEENELKLLYSVDEYKNNQQNNSTTVRSRNPILLFELNQPKEKYFYDDLSKYLQVNTKQILPNGINDIGFVTNSTASKLKKNITEKELKKMSLRKFDICSVDRDPLRKLLMPISYNLYQWLMKYFIPASKIRNDISISNLTHFIELIKTYQTDPCNRLIRNDNDGSYYVDPQLSIE